MKPSPDSAPPGGPDSGPWPYGPFVLVRKLAEGGMAEVFLALRREADGTERAVVIKRMLASLAGQGDFVAMFRDEARLAAQLVHPHLVRVREMGCIESRDYLCMDFLPGEDFSTLVRRASQRGEYVPVPLVLRVLADAARGLHHAHELREASGQPLHIVHRDVSPANLYVTYTGQVKVLDFGIAKATSLRTRTRPGLVKGKFLYMAPEQARGEEVDRRADVFSLGVSLYEALTHVRPFARDEEGAVLQALLRGEHAPPRSLRPELSPELEAVVLQAMANAPARRYATAALFADALERLLAREPSVPAPADLGAYLRTSLGEAHCRERSRVPSLASLGEVGRRASEARASVVFAPPTTPAPVSRRPRAWRLVAGLGVVGVLLAGGVWVVSHGREPSPPIASAPPPPSPPVAVAAPPPPRPPPAVAPEARGPSGRARGSLEVADVLRGVSQRRARLMACFERYKRELPSREGDVQVRFAIAASGRTDATVLGPLAKSHVGRCLERVLDRLRFPAHRDEVVEWVVPVGYSVTP